jgi:hypothetical protein
LVTLLTGCAGPRYVPVTAAPSFPLPNTVAADAVLRASPDARAELAALPAVDRPAVALRRAFLELELGHAEAAIAATSLVLYGPARPSPNDASFAHYLRARAYEQRGTPDLARFDRDRARSLALDPGLRALLENTAPAAAGNVGALAAVAVLPRAQWHAARPDRANLDRMDSVTRITIHHSAIYLRDTHPAAAATQLQHIQREHMQERGYGDIGYHFLIDPAGRVWQGRELQWQGAHAGGANNVRNVGVCVLGNFVHGSKGQDPTAAQVAALVELVTALRARFGVPAARIYRHGDLKATECPGPRMAAVMAKLRSAATDPSQFALGR